MEGGRIVEVGDHDMLMAAGGRYRELVEHQLDTGDTNGLLVLGLVNCKHGISTSRPHRRTGQDGAYLTELLLSKGYEVHGIKRRASLFNTDRIDHLYQDPHEEGIRLKLHYGDLTDSTNLIRIVQEVQPHEIYNLAAMSHVQVSFDTPEYTADVDGLGTLRLLEAIRILGLEQDVRFYQAATSELYGKAMEVPQSETTPFYPRSTYGVVYSYCIENYREAYGIHASNGILQPRGPCAGKPVTRKSPAPSPRSHWACRTRSTSNLDAQRIRPCQTTSKACGACCNRTTRTTMSWPRGEPWPSARLLRWRSRSRHRPRMARERRGRGVDRKTGAVLVAVDPRYFRPTEVDLLVGDATKAKEVLGWTPSHSLEQLCAEMVASDVALFKRDKYLLDGGHNVLDQHEI